MLASPCARTIPRTSQTLLKVRGYSSHSGWHKAAARELAASACYMSQIGLQSLDPPPAGAHPPASSEESLGSRTLDALASLAQALRTGSFSEPYVLMADIVSVRV